MRSAVQKVRGVSSAFIVYGNARLVFRGHGERGEGGHCPTHTYILTLLAGTSRGHKQRTEQNEYQAPRVCSARRASVTDGWGLLVTQPHLLEAREVVADWLWQRVSLCCAPHEPTTPHRSSEGRNLFCFDFPWKFENIVFNFFTFSWQGVSFSFLFSLFSMFFTLYVFFSNLNAGF